MAAYFLLRRGERMSHLKLMKLLYLADREAMDKYSMPISGDKMASLPNGPVLSMTLDYMNGALKSQQGGWEYWISDKANHEVTLKNHIDNISRQSFDELSDADIEILDTIWDQFGSMTRWEIKDYTHENCKEWVDPHGSSNPISPKELFIALGRSPQEAAELCAYIESDRSTDDLFAGL